MKKHEIRFHLAEGEHFEHWQIRYADGKVRYADPALFTLNMTGVYFHIRPKAAKEVHEGANKFPHCWAKVDTVEVIPALHGMPTQDGVLYNPKVAPYWRHKDENVNFKRIDHAQSYGRRIYI